MEIETRPHVETIVPIRTGLFRYVPHDQVEAFHRAGWMIVQADLGRYHGCFSVLMWRCGCQGVQEF